MARMMTPVSGSSRTPMVGDRISSLVDDLFSDFFDRGPWSRPDLGATDIYEVDGTLWIETALPGLRREEVDVRLKNDRLIVRGTYGQDRDPHVPEANYLQKGRPSGQFETAFPLPEQVANGADDVEVTFIDGNLKVGVPLEASIVDTGVEIDVQ